jgi:hypothetical protein
MMLTECENQEVARIQKEVEHWLASKKSGEYLRTDKNKELLAEYLAEHELDITAPNLEKAHFALLSMNPCPLDEDPAGGLNFANIGQRDPSKRGDRVIRKDLRNMTAEEFANAVSSSRSFRQKIDAASRTPRCNCDIPLFRRSALRVSAFA